MPAPDHIAHSQRAMLRFRGTAFSLQGATSRLSKRSLALPRCVALTLMSTAAPTAAHRSPSGAQHRASRSAKFSRIRATLPIRGAKVSLIAATVRLPMRNTRAQRRNTSPRVANAFPQSGNAAPPERTHNPRAHIVRPGRRTTDPSTATNRRQKESRIAAARKEPPCNAPRYAALTSGVRGFFAKREPSDARRDSRL